MTDAGSEDLDAEARDVDPSETKVRWSCERKVRRGLWARLFLARYAVGCLPPITGWTLVAWILPPVLVAIAWLGIWYIGAQVPGSSDVDSEVRWAADISLVIFLLAAIFTPSTWANDRDQREMRFRGGRLERAAVVGYQYGIRRGDRWISVRLVAIRRVRRLFGIAAVQLPSGKYWFLPSELFLSRSDWVKAQQLLSSR
jgi:hypothetical protein